MFGDCETQGKRAQVGHLAEKIDWFFRVAAFEFAVRGTHAAKRGDAAVGADGLACVPRLANVFEARVPARGERSLSQLVALAVRQHANGHAAFRVDRAAVMATAAGVPF